MTTIKEIFLTPFNVIFYIMILLFGVIVYFFTNTYDAPTYFMTSYYSSCMHWSALIFLISFFVFRTFYVMVFIHPKNLIHTITFDLKHFFTTERLLTAIPIILIIPFFFSVFTTAKNMIPIINPFSWDPFLSRLDLTLHIGRHPWEWMQPILGITVISLAISFAYKMWFIIKIIVIYWQAFSLKYKQKREQFFIALLLIWILNGVIIATVFSSVGPCFYGLAYPYIDDPYASLMTYLKNVPILDLKAQSYLWNAYAGKTPLPFSGISAFPSMHVSLSCLFAIIGWHYRGFLRWAFIVFFGLTVIGSIHLGWHYAVDGYLACITTPIFWWLSGKFVEFYSKQSLCFRIIPNLIRKMHFFKINMVSFRRLS